MFGGVALLSAPVAYDIFLVISFHAFVASITGYGCVLCTTFFFGHFGFGSFGFVLFGLGFLRRFGWCCVCHG